MTIIAYKETDGIIQIAADSAIKDQGLVSLENKLCHVGDFIFGLSGYQRDANLFYNFLLKNPVKKIPKKYTPKDFFYDYILSYSKFYKKYLNPDDFGYSSIILISKFVVLEINGFCVTEIKPNTACAIGSGRRFALSSMLNGFSPTVSVLNACSLDINSRPPVHKITIEKSTWNVSYLRFDGPT